MKSFSTVKVWTNAGEFTNFGIHDPAAMIDIRIIADAAISDVIWMDEPDIVADRRIPF